MDFGLGLVLSFVDNASAGMNSATASLNGLTQVAERASTSVSNLADSTIMSSLAYSAGQLGDTFLSMGNSITGVFKNLLSNVVKTGSDFESFRITLNALYGDVKETDKAIEKLLDFSATTPFEVTDVKDMLVVLKSQGLDAFQEIQGSISGVKQETLAWIGDLMSFKPEVTAQRWKLAFTNYIGSGHFKVLRNILDMGELEDIIGRAPAKTIEGRLQDVIDIVEKKNLTGLMSNLYGTWQQTLSNVSDQWTRFYKAIGDAGVFDQLKESLINITGAIASINEDRLEKFGGVLKNSLQFVLKPMQKLSKMIAGVINKFVDLTETHPKLAQLVITLVAMTGVMLTMIGVGLRIISSFAGVATVFYTLSASSMSFAGLFKIAMGKIVGAIAPVLLAIGGLALAWNTNFGGIRDLVTDFSSSVTNSFTMARDIVTGSVDNMASKLEELRNSDSIFAKLTIAMAQVMVLFQALSELSRGDGFTLSEDTFLKAEQLGILPLIESILDLKYRFQLFKEGFIQGWNEISGVVKDVIGGIVSKIKEIIGGSDLLTGVFNGIAKAFKTIAGPITQANFDSWTEFGRVTGKFAPLLIALTPVLLKLKGIITTLGAVALPIMAGAITSFSGIVASAGGLKALLLGIIPAVTGLFHSFVGFTSLGVLVHQGFGAWIGDLVAQFPKIGTLVTSVFSGTLKAYQMTIGNILNRFFPQTMEFLISTFSSFGSRIIPALSGGLSSVGTYLMGLVGSAGGFFASLLTKVGGVVSACLPNFVTVAFSKLGTVLVAVFGNLSTIFAPIMSALAPFISSIGSGIVALLGASIGGVPVAMVLAITAGISAVVALITGNSDKITGAFNKVWDKLPVGVQNAILKVVGFLTDTFNGIVQKLGLEEIVSNIGTTFMQIVNVLSIVGGVVVNFVTTVANWIGMLFNNFIMPIVTTGIECFKSMWDSWLGGLIANVMTFVGYLAGAFAVIMNNVIMPLITWIMTYVVPVVKSIITTIMNIITPIINHVGIVVNTIMNVFNGLIQFFVGIFSGNLSGAWAGIKNIFSSAWEGIQKVFSNVQSFFSGVFSGIVDIFSTVGTAISDAITGAVKFAINTVLRGAIGIINGFIGAINGCIGAINKIPGVNIGKISTLGVPQLATGGVLEEATMAVVGEDGAEAVMPLEKNTEWIGVLANKITHAMPNSIKATGSVTANSEDSSLVLGAVSTMAEQLTSFVDIVGRMVSNAEPMQVAPVLEPTANTQPISSSGESYVTNNNQTSGATSNDNSVTFEEGSIVIQMQGSGEQDIDQMIDLIMKKIKRRREIEGLLSYQ